MEISNQIPRMVNPILKAYFSKIGKKGGSAKGETKKRCPLKMAAASKKRWKNWETKTGRKTKKNDN